jgi:hypothetical protein
MIFGYSKSIGHAGYQSVRTSESQPAATKYPGVEAPVAQVPCATVFRHG